MMIIMKDSYFVRDISLFLNKNMNSHKCTEDQHHFFVITLISVNSAFPAS